MNGVSDMVNEFNSSPALNQLLNQTREIPTRLDARERFDMIGKGNYLAAQPLKSFALRRSQGLDPG